MPNLTNIWSRASSAVTASGNSGGLPTGAYASLAVDINVTVLTGTTPTIQFQIDRLGYDGNWYTVWTSSAISAPQAISVSVGPGCGVNHALTSQAIIRWTVGGTTPSVTFSASAVGV